LPDAPYLTADANRTRYYETQSAQLNSTQLGALITALGPVYSFFKKELCHMITGLCLYKRLSV